jgi:uridine kinase
LLNHPLHLSDDLAVKLTKAFELNFQCHDEASRNSLSIHRPLVVGISGASCSGKSWMADKFHQEAQCGSQIIDLDGYYRELEEVTFLEHGHDNPDSIHFDQAIRDLARLKSGQPADLPVYCFETHKALGFRQCVPTPVIIVEGLFIFARREMREMLDVKIWMDTNQALRLARRIDRDTTQRERTIEEITERYQRDVVPGFNKFIQPLHQHADIIVSNEGQDVDIPPGAVKFVLELLQRLDS